MYNKIHLACLDWHRAHPFRRYHDSHEVTLDGIQTTLLFLPEYNIICQPNSMAYLQKILYFFQILSQPSICHYLQTFQSHSYSDLFLLLQSFVLLLQIQEN
jgi:hypothetical protein